MIAPTPVLSIRQPWAWLIVNAPLKHRKTHEVRDWPPAYGARRRVEEGKVRTLWVHAAKSLTRTTYDDARAFAVEVAGFPPEHFPALNALPRGVIVGLVDVVGWGQSFGSPWFTGAWGLETASPRPLDRPVECSGALGLWTPPPPVAAELARARSTWALGTKT